MIQETYAGRTKYDETRSRKYQKRPPDKHVAEMRLLDRAFALIPSEHRVLDAPCGGGRVTIHLAKKGYRVRAADLSEAMVKIARENIATEHLDCPVEQQDIEKLTLPDRSVDTIVSFRLFHHFPNQGIRRRVVNELCRVAARNVVLSYFSPLSLTSAKNTLRAKVGGKQLKKFPTSLPEIEGYFATNGFQLVKDFAQLPLVHTLHVAVFERRTQAQ
jgi:2-polyprenyl-3-methyl-5-hydroxy-6-metoxy-1,4-benzoquinol methylase